MKFFTWCFLTTENVLAGSDQEYSLINFLRITLFQGGGDVPWHQPAGNFGHHFLNLIGVTQLGRHS